VYHQAVSDVTAFILAGGRSSRMGQDKAFLELAGRTLLDRALDLAASVAPEVRVVGDQTKFLHVGRTIEDVFPGRGPLGGIHAALTKSQTELNLVIAVDLPFLEPRFLSYLLSQASQTTTLATVPRTGDGWQPLCAVYRQDFAPVAEQSLRKKRNKIDALFKLVETREIGDVELRRMGFADRMFRNLNTPEDLQAAERALAENPR